MATQVQLRRGTEAENNAFTGVEGEITIDTTNNVIRIHDGVLPGGFATVMANSDQTLITGDILPAANITYSLGNADRQWSNLYLAGNTIFLGPLQIKAIDDNTLAVFTSDGSTQANIDVGNVDVAAISQGNSVIGISGVGGNAYIDVNGTGNVLVASATGVEIAGDLLVSNIASDDGSFVYINDSLQVDQSLGVSGNINGGNLTTVGLVSATGNVSGGNITTTGNVSGGNLVTTGLVSAATTITATGNVAGGNITTIGQIAATGNVSGGNITTGGAVDATGNVSGGNVTTAGRVDATGNVTGGNLVTVGLISATGNVSGGNITTGGQVAAVGNITANYFLGNGSQLTGIDATSIQNGTSNMRIPVADGNVTGNIDGNTVFNLSATGLIVTGSIEATNGFVGLDATKIADGNSELEVLSPGGNIQGNIAGNTVLALNSAGLIITGSIEATNGFVGLDATKIEDGTSNVAVLSANGNIQGTVAGSEILLLSSEGANITGNVTAALFNGTLATAAQPNITSVGNLTSLTVTGNIDAGNVESTGEITAGSISTAGNITAGNLSISASISTPGDLTVTGNALVVGNLVVTGTETIVNINNLAVTDPIIGLGRGANNTPLTTNDGLDRGTEMWYYTSQEQAAFVGYINLDGKLVAATNVSIANNIVTVNDYGVIVVGTLEGATANVTGNIIAAGAEISGNVTANYFLGDGSELTNLPSATGVANGTSEISIPVANGPVTVQVNGVANSAVFSVGEIFSSGIFSNPRTINDPFTITGNINGLLIGPVTVDALGNITVPDTSALTVV